MRQGIRIRGDRGNPEVRRALVKFARWLRTQYDFPIRVPVYLLPTEEVITRGGETGSASFFAPFKRTEEPYIRIATGDYMRLKRELGRDDALAAFICSMAHEVVHYRQWVQSGRTSERGVSNAAGRLLRRYAKTESRP